MGIRKLTVTNATKTADGWRIVAQSPNKVVRFIDVDEEGIGDDCEPWDDELEEKFGPADPEHNVVILNHAEHKAPDAEPEPEQPPAEVVDINEKWAERDARARSFIEGVNAIQDLSAVDEQRENIKKFSNWIDELILLARSDEQQYAARRLEWNVAVYKELTPRAAHQMAPHLEDEFAFEGAFIRGEEAPESPQREPLDFMARAVWVEAVNKVNRRRNNQDREWNEALARAEARKADRHGTQ